MKPVKEGQLWKVDVMFKFHYVQMKLKKGDETMEKINISLNSTMFR